MMTWWDMIRDLCKAKGFDDDECDQIILELKDAHND